jgi:hypothetical protein
MLCTAPFKKLSWRTASFFMGVLVYAGGGSPTPDRIGLIEIVIALLLLPAVTIPPISRLPAGAALLMLYGLSIPLITGAASGHDPLIILRDLIPFLFLFLPVFFLPVLKSRFDALAFVVTAAGFIFAARSLFPYHEVVSYPQLWLNQPPADLLYLANSPEVLFAALMMIGTGGLLIWSRRSMVWGSCLVVAASVPILSMAVMMQRAGLGCVVLACVIWAALGLWLRPGRMLPVAGLTLCLILPILPLIEMLAGSLAYKTELVGLNSRAQEWETVMDMTGRSFWSILFGLGWGTSFENPAVGHLTVNYTHSLISALFLKTGIVGVGLFGFYLWIIIKQAVPDLCRRPILMIALAAPLGIGLLLYASYKSLGFGLILLLLGSSGERAENLEKNRKDMR